MGKAWVFLSLSIILGFSTIGQAKENIQCSDASAKFKLTQTNQGGWQLSIDGKATSDIQVRLADKTGIGTAEDDSGKSGIETFVAYAIFNTGGGQKFYDAAYVLCEREWSPLP